MRDAHLSIEAPDPRAQPAVEWAKSWLEESIYADPADSSPPAPELICAVMAHLAIGLFDPPRRWIRRLADDAAGKSKPGAAAACLLLAARYHAWTADHAYLREEWPRFERALDLCDGSRPDATGVLVAALRDFAIAAEAMGAAEAARITNFAQRTRLAVKPPDATPVLHDALARAMAILLGSADREQEAGWIDGVAALDTRSITDAAGAASSLVSLVHGTLGVEPDAPRHRLRLRPRLPPAWNTFRLRNLALGDATVELHFDRAGHRSTFTLEQTAGATPLRVIFEPAIPAAPVLAMVDGVTAALHARPLGGRFVVPVQLVLDHPRTIVLESS